MADRLENILTKHFRRGPMDAQSTAQVCARAGLLDNVDQRGFRQITIISQEQWQTVTAAMGVEAEPSVRRANLLVSGINLKKSGGKVLVIGTCQLKVNGETRPCERMDQALPGLRTALDSHWTGDVYTEVLNDAVIPTGDKVSWEEDL
jgi:MOSC domain-containing protein YiiM